MFARLAAFFGAPPPESPPEPRSSTHEWLEQVKPGYAERFGGAFDELGIEDTDDLLHLDDELYTTLQQQLEAFGARSMHRFNIQRALHEFLVDSDSDWLPPQMEETGNGGGSSCGGSSSYASEVAAAAASSSEFANSSAADARLFDRGSPSPMAATGSSTGDGSGVGSAVGGGSSSETSGSSAMRLIDQLPDLFGIISTAHAVDDGSSSPPAPRDFPPQLEPYARAVAEYIAEHFPTSGTTKPSDFDRIFSQADRGVLRDTAQQAGRTLPQVRRSVDLLMPFDERRRAAFAILRKSRWPSSSSSSSSSAAPAPAPAPSSSSPSKPAWNPHHTRGSETLPSHLGAFPPPVFPLQAASAPKRRPQPGGGLQQQQQPSPPPKPTAAALADAAKASAKSVSAMADLYGDMNLMGGSQATPQQQQQTQPQARQPSTPPPVNQPHTATGARKPPAATTPPKPLTRAGSQKAKASASSSSSATSSSKISSPKMSPKAAGKRPKSPKRPASARATAKRPSSPGPGSPAPPQLSKTPSYSERQRKQTDKAFARGTLTSVNQLPSPPKPPKRTAAFASDTIRGDPGIIPVLNSTPPPSVKEAAAPAAAAAAVAAAAAADPNVPNAGTSHFMSLGGRFNFASLVREQEQEQQQQQQQHEPAAVTSPVSSPPSSSSGAGGGGGRSRSKSPPHSAEAEQLRRALLISDLSALTPAPGTPPFAFGTSPPEWLIAAAADGCRDLADVARVTSLEHQGPIDALEQSGEVLAEYGRWLLMASKRVAYLRQKEVEARRSQAAILEKEMYAQRGKALQQQAWEQRGQAAEAERRLLERKQAEAAVVKQQALARKADQQHRESLYEAYSKFVHDEIHEAQSHVEEAKAAVAEHNAAVGSTIRAVKGALEQKKSELQAAKEAEARAARDRVKASSMVMVPPEVAAQIARREGKRPIKS